MWCRALVEVLMFEFQQQHQLAELGKKQIEQTLRQLQEKLQLNIIQQTHIIQSGDKKKASSGPLQQLVLQQQQLIQQIQLVQRQYVVHQGMGMQPLMLGQGPGRKRKKAIGRNSDGFVYVVNLNEKVK